MPPTPPTQQMGERHEKDVAEALGMTKTRGSGNGHEKGDASHHHDLPFAFRMDAKSTRGKQIAVTRAMLEKLREQAGGERPALPLRWYANEALTEVAEDWIAVTLMDFSELLLDARSWAELIEALALAHPVDGGPVTGTQIARMVLDWRSRMNECEQADNGGELARLREEVKSLRTASASLEAYNAQAGDIIRRLRDDLATRQVPVPDNGRPSLPGYIPLLPWTVVHQVHTPGGVVNSGMHFNAEGHQATFDVRSVRVERSLGSGNRPRLIVNDTIVRQGAVYVDGFLQTQVCEGNREIEVG